MKDDFKKNSEHFLGSFNEVERFLRRTTGSGPEIGFRHLVAEGSKQQPVVKRFSDDLRELADLRNAIVHQSKGVVIAEPHLRTCSLLDHILGLLIDPPQVLPRFGRAVFSVTTSSPVAEVVSKAFKRSFSQFPVSRDGKFVGVLSTNTIVRWLGANVADDIFSLEESAVGDVLEYTEFPHNFEFVARDADLLTVSDLFNRHDEKGERLEAVLVSHNGKQTEKILGIVSPWDLPEIHSVLEGV